MFFLLHNPSFWAAAITAAVLIVLSVWVRCRQALPVVALVAAPLLALAGWRTAALEAVAVAVLWLYITQRLRWYLLVMVLLLLPLLLLVKPGSSGGRWFILRQTAALIRQHPGGVGIGRFAVEYGLQQAAYFRQHGTHGKEALRAGNTQFALNEYLQVTAEAGIAAGMLFLLGNLLLLRMGIRQCRRRPSWLLCCALTGFAAIAVGNCSYYLLHNAWVLLLYGICVVALLLLRYTTPAIALRCCVVLLLAGAVAAGTGTYRENRGQELLLQAGQFSMAGYRLQSDSLFTLAGTCCHNHVNYYTALATHHLRYHQPAAAVACLQRAAALQTHSDIFHLLGNAALQLGDTAQAIRQYEAELYTMPCLLGPRKQLANLYHHLQQPGLEKYWLQSMVRLLAKVSSAAATVMRTEAAQRLQQQYRMVGRTMPAGTLPGLANILP